MNNAKYLIVNVDGDGKHEIVWVSSNPEVLMKRWFAYSGDGAVYEISTDPVFLQGGNYSNQRNREES